MKAFLRIFPRPSRGKAHPHTKLRTLFQVSCGDGAMPRPAESKAPFFLMALQWNNGKKKKAGILRSRRAVGGRPDNL